MPAPPSIPAVTRLRALAAIPGGIAAAAAAVPFGIAALDRRLARGGLGPDALHEVAAARPTLADEAAATMFVAGAAARVGAGGRPVLWALPRFDLYAPGLEQAGLPPARLLYAEARTDAEVLAVMEDALRHGAAAAVVGEVRRADMTATRRLQLAAATAGAPAFLFRRWRRAGAAPLAAPSAAATRWRIGCAASPALAHPGLGRPHWLVELVRQRGGEPVSLTLEGCDAQGRLALPAPARDRAAAAGGAAIADAA